MRQRIEELLKYLGEPTTDVYVPTQEHIDRAEALAIYTFGVLGKGMDMNGSTVTTAVLAILMNRDFIFRASDTDQ